MGKAMCVKRGVLVRVAIGLFLGGIAAVASAQQPTPDEAPTVYAFDDDLVQGDTLGPNVEVLHARRRGARDSLIKARENFIDALIKSVEDL